jgi:hypothetical protein
MNDWRSRRSSEGNFNVAARILSLDCSLVGAPLGYAAATPYKLNREEPYENSTVENI